LAGPIGTVTVAARADGEETSKVTQAGLVTMTPPVKPVKRGPHTGSRTLLREAVTRAWPEKALNSSPMRDGESYTSLASGGTGYGDRGEGCCGRGNGEECLIDEVALAAIGCADRIQAGGIV
jgi:hypothetical protein